MNRFRASILIAVAVLTVLALTSVGQAQEPVTDTQVVIVMLQDQTQLALAREVQREYEPQLERLGRAVARLGGWVNREGAEVVPEGLPRGLATAELRAAHRTAAQALDTALHLMRQEILARGASARLESQGDVAAAVEAMGGTVLYRYTIINAMALALPPGAVETLVDHPQVAQVYEDQVMRSGMDISAFAIGADTWWGAGYTGGVWDVAVIDSGVDRSHPALSHLMAYHLRCLQTADTYYPGLPGYDPTYDDVNGHGTHIAGTIAMSSTIPLYRGIAYGLDTFFSGKAAYDLDGHDDGFASMYWSDSMACVDWALRGSIQEADVINLSYGSQATTDDSYIERFWDAVVDEMGAVVTISAGNNGPNPGTIHSPSIAYNVISVANVNDGNTIWRGDDIIATTSSRGFTPGGRKKPDLSAPGSGIVSTNNDWEVDLDFVTYSGTSMAAPHVAGAATLLMDWGVTSPMAIKALLINTAEDRGDEGWDPVYGWGYLDMTHLYSHVSHYRIASVGPEPSFRLYSGSAAVSETATLVWHRRAVYNNAVAPTLYYALTDLDLYAYDELDETLLDLSTSGVDNVEQVAFTDTYTQVVIKVDTWSTDIIGTDWEQFALATEGSFFSREGPAFDLGVVTGGDIGGSGGEVLTVTATVTNTGDLIAHDLDVYVTYSPGVTLTSGTAHTASLLADGDALPSYTWTLTKLDGSVPTIRVWTMSDSYGESFQSMWQWGGWQLYLPLAVRGS